MKKNILIPILTFVVCITLQTQKSLAQPGSLDTTFNPASAVFTQGLFTGITTVYKSVQQPDGKIIIAGAFSSYNGSTINTNLIRINTNGTTDPGFNSGLVQGSAPYIYDLALQADGKIVIGGSFESYNGVSRKGIARLNTDGSLDNGFDPGNGFNYIDPYGINQGIVFSISIQSNGQIITVGSFSEYNGISRKGIARLNVDGSIDNDFDPGASINFIAPSGGFVPYTTLQSDGKIILSGFVTSDSGGNNAILRLNTDGSVDNSFNSNPVSGIYNFNQVFVQPDDKLIVEGNIQWSNGWASLFRLNADGSIDSSFNPGGNESYVPFGDLDIKFQADGKIILAGNFDHYGNAPYTINNSTETPAGMIRLLSDGIVDTGFTAAHGIPIYGGAGIVSFTELQSNLKIVVGINRWTDGNFYVERLNSDGSLDVQNADGPNTAVRSASVQTDGRIIIGGDFTSYDGITRNRLARLNTDGSLDESFMDINADNTVYTTAVQSDGKIIAGGYSQAFGSRPIVRLNTNGSEDVEFGNNLSFGGTSLSGLNPLLFITKIITQPDGKIIILGQEANSQATETVIARKNEDGSTDASFLTGASSGTYYTAALQSDGKILIGGSFELFGTPGLTNPITSVNRLLRINPDGSFDPGFNSGNAGVDGGVYSIAVQPDGKIIIGGFFHTYNGIERNGIARLNTDGSLDLSFVPGSEYPYGTSGVYYGVNSTVLLNDGKIIAGGSFNNFLGAGGISGGLIRLKPNGTIDSSFVSGNGVYTQGYFGGNILTMSLQSNGNLIIGGYFNTYDDNLVKNVARILTAPCNNTVAPIVTITASPSGLICAGTPVTFTATSVNGGDTPVYQWKKNGEFVGSNSPFYTDSTLTNGKIISCKLTSNLLCALPDTANSNSITMSVTTPVDPSVSITITSGTNPDCSGAELGFTATAIYGGESPVFLWKLNGNDVGGNQPDYTLSNPANNDVVSCSMTSNQACAGTTTAFSNLITVKTPVAFNAGIGYGTLSVCSEGTLNFSAVIFSGGGESPQYQWKLNGQDVPGANTSGYSQTGFTAGDQITCTITSSEACASPSVITTDPPLTISVYDISLASLSIYGGPATLCEGNSATFCASPSNAGLNPGFQWKKNGQNLPGETGYCFTDNNPSAGEVVTCELTTDPACGTSYTVPGSNSITIENILPVSTPTISIAASQPLISPANNFTATITHGGSSPTYQWNKNGLDVPGETSSSYLDLALVNGDVITCSLTSSEPCAIPTTVVSNTLTSEYCTPSAGNSYGECSDTWITNVQLGTSVNKATGCDGFYSNFSNTDTLKSAAGETITYSITGGSNGSNWYQRRAIYIDFNKDGDFIDAGENVVDIATGALEISIATFPLPQGLASGSYRIRVVGSFDDNFSPCTANSGEAEDYTLTVSYCTPHSPGNSTACQYYYTSNVTLGSSVYNSTGCDGFYSDYSATQILSAAAGQTINYSVSLGSIDAQNWGTNLNIYIDYNNNGSFDDAGEKIVDNQNLDVFNPATGNFTLPSLLAYGNYRIRVVSSSGGTITPSACELDYGEAEDYTLLIPEPIYCVPVISQPCDMWISNVTIGTINNSSPTPSICDADGYTDYSPLLSTTAAPGQTVNFSLTGGSSAYWGSWQYADFFADFNNDGDFDDEGERVVQDFSFYSGYPYTGSFSIPEFQSYGYYRIRVKSYNYDSGIDTYTGPCGNNVNGEVEDYRLIVDCVPNGSDIVLQGNNADIADGDNMPDLADFTDFGDVEVGTTFDRIFTITNNGTHTLNLTDNVTIDGDWTSGFFTVWSQPVTYVLDIGESATFTVRVDVPSWAYGNNLTATIHVANDNCSKKDYDFALQATGSCPAFGPDINVQGNGLDIARFDWTPMPEDNTDFGTVTANNTADKTFVIQNTGNTDLHISNIQLSNYDNQLQFAVTSQPPTTIAPGETGSFVLGFSPAGSGSRYAYVRINSDDCDESYYDFQVIGNAECPLSNPEVNVQGNGIDIPDGDNSPAETDNTNFGITVIGSSVTKTFDIGNLGADPLHISGIDFSGVNATAFAIVTMPAATIPPGGSTSFSIQFSPLVYSIVTATVHIHTDDCDEGDYDFVVQGSDGSPCIPVVQQPCSYVYISNVTIGGINKSSGCDGGYADYSATVSTTAQPGANVNFSVTNGGIAGQNVNIYADLNTDGDFDDPGEQLTNLVYSDAGASATGTFSIPPSQAPGNYRLRVVSEFFGYGQAIPCSAYYGEIEDYMLIVEQPSQYEILNLTLFLEGLYTGAGIMTKAQGSSGDQFPGTVADQVTIELHGNTPPYSTAYSFSNIDLHTDGTLSVNTIPVGINGSYYVVIKHRNSIETWSSSAISFGVENPATYDFSSSASQAFGGNEALVSDNYVIYGGDVNQDDVVDTADMTPVDNDGSNFVSGYIPTDVNGDGIVDTGDMTIVDNNAALFVGTVSP